MQKNYILSLDLGTTNIKALLLDFSDPNRPKNVCCWQKPVKFIVTDNAFLEHDLEQIWLDTLETIKELITQAKIQIKGFTAHKIVALGLSNQRETLCLFDKKSKKGLKSISWQCKRSLELCKSISLEKNTHDLYRATGLRLDPYFTGTKILWSIRNDSTLLLKLKQKEILIGTLDTYILYRLTDASSYLTEASNASRTLLYNLKDKTWDVDLKELMGLSAEIDLATIIDSSGDFGSTKGLGDVLPDGIKITAVLGDQQAALVGQLCLAAGMGKCTYRTGAFLLFNTGADIVQKNSNLLTTVAYSHAGQFSYALEGAAFVAGGVIDFIKNNLSFITDIKELSLAEDREYVAPELYFVPAFVGLGSPWWQANAKATIFGLSLQTSKKQIIKAALEGVALQVQDLIKTASASGYGLERLCVDGGMSQNDYLLEFQSFLAQSLITRPAEIKTSALGAGYFAALGCGIFKNVAELQNIKQESINFTPKSSLQQNKQRELIISGWKNAIAAVRDYYSDNKK